MSDIKLAEDTAAESTLHNGGVISRFMDGFRAIPRVVLWFIVVVWATPTVGLLISGLRTRDDQRSSGWWTGLNPTEWTFENYDTVFGASASGSLGDSLLNSFAITIPATIIPIAVAAFAALRSEAALEFAAAKRFAAASAARFFARSAASRCFSAALTNRRRRATSLFSPSTSELEESSSSLELLVP